MNIFILGGCHVENYGIRANLGFVQQWATHLKLTCSEPVNITYRSMIKLRQLPDLQPRYQEELAQADLIVLQLGHYELSWRKRFIELFHVARKPSGNSVSQLASSKANAKGSTTKLSPISRRERLKNKVKASFLTLSQAAVGQLPFLNQFSDELTTAFSQFLPYQEKVIVLTPFPTLNEVDQWLRRASHPIIQETAIQAGFTLVDTFRSVPRQETYFLADGIHLNSLGHLLIAMALSELPHNPRLSATIQTMNRQETDSMKT